MREVPCVGEDLEPASRNQPMRRTRVLDRDDRVALAPDVEERDGLRELRAIARVHPLPPGVDDRPEGLQECRAGFPVRERGVAS